MWLGMFGIVCGLIMVGVADIVFGSNDTQDKNGIISGTASAYLLLFSKVRFFPKSLKICNKLFDCKSFLSLQMTVFFARAIAFVCTIVM